MKSYNLLKDYKQQNGHVKVPIKHIEQGFKLGSWLKTQITQYRNKLDDKQPALCDDRARMLEEIGVQWGQKRVTTPWDARYEDLLDFKRRFGHVNVPWQWKENISLAQWVNSQVRFHVFRYSVVCSSIVLTESAITFILLEKEIQGLE